MVSKELNDWLQVVGLFGVLGGLIFVGLQIRLDRQVALSESVARANDARLYWAEIIGENSQVWVKGLSADPLSPTEAAEFGALARAWEITYYRAWNGAVQLGQQDPDRFVREAALDFQTHPGLMQFWRTHVERQNQVNPNSPTGWLAAVNAEIRRLEDRASAP